MKNKIKWLLNFASKLSSKYSKVLDHDLEDFSEDCIKIFFHKERFSNFLKGEDTKVVPITFEIWPSLTCDARCALCTYSLNNARKEADTSDQLYFAENKCYENILKKFKEAGVNSIILTGGGEPTLHPRLDDLARYTNNLGFSWGMFTHGMHLKEKITHDLLQAKPRFIRLSINSGSSRGHAQEYRIGNDTYAIVKKNAIKAARISKSYNKCIGLGYALNGKIGTDELVGIREFVTEVMEESDGGLKSIAFRPKVVYYKKNGIPVSKQPFLEELDTLPIRIRQYIIFPLRKRFGDLLNIDLKAGMFDRLSTETSPTNSIATGWAGSIDHLGNGYIISELNGSPWPDSKYGDYSSTSSFYDVWHGEKRLGLLNKYKSGKILAPAHHKLSHVDNFLKKIRSNIGTTSQKEVNTFYSEFDKLEIERPSNWDFL